MLNTIKNNFIKPLTVFLIEQYFIFRKWQPMWLYLNRKGRQLLKSNPPNLNEVQKRIVADLKNNGIAASHLDELFPGEKLLPWLQKYTADLIAAPEKKIGTKKQIFLRYLLDERPKLSFENPFVTLSLNQKILDIVNSYYGTGSKFYYFTLNVTEPMPKSAAAVFSQNWHRDPEDKKVCKMFIYLNDVDEGSGPFTYIPGSQTNGRHGNLFPQRPPTGFYPPAGAVEKRIGEEGIKACLGKAGIVLFVDTAGLHKGGYATAKERIMFTA